MCVVCCIEPQQSVHVIVRISGVLKLNEVGISAERAELVSWDSGVVENVVRSVLAMSRETKWNNESLVTPPMRKWGVDQGEERSCKKDG